MSEGQTPQGCSGTARVLIVVILVVAIAAVGLAIYTGTTTAPPANRMTPGGANYNPSQPDAVTKPATP